MWNLELRCILRRGGEGGSWEAIIAVIVTHCAAKLPIFSEQWLEDHLIVMNKDPIRALLLATIALMMDNRFGGSHLVFFVEANKGSFSSFEFILPPGTELKTYTWKGSILFRVGASQPGDFIFLFTDKQSGSPPLTSNWETWLPPSDISAPLSRWLLCRKTQPLPTILDSEIVQRVLFRECNARQLPLGLGCGCFLENKKTPGWSGGEATISNSFNLHTTRGVSIFL